MNHPEVRIAWLLCCLTLPLCGEASKDKPPDSIDRLELRRHAEMLSTMRTNDTALAAFTTDGCSGGLSIGWQYLAMQVAAVRSTHGELPPWEACCVEHDHLYHAAVPVESTPEDSFRARKQADEALHSCVIDTGFDRATSLSNDYEVSIETVEGLYTSIADLMYRAVRVGGVPCSGLPWRWGYGWPQCE
jgi:hypothetical protein